VRSYLDAFFGENLKSETKTALEAPPSDSAVRIQAFTPR